MPSKIEFASDQAPLVRGQKHPVRILVHFEKPTKVRGIRALVWGAERTEATYTTTRTDSEGRTTTTTHTAVQHAEIIKEQLLLQGEERLGFFSRIGDSLATWVGAGKHEILGPGTQEFNIDVDVPVNAPASFQGKKCSVFYKVDVSVDLPIKIDWFESLELELPTEKPELVETSPVHIVFPDESGRSFWDKTFGKPVTLNLAIDRDTLTSGEKAMAMLTIESPEPLQIKKIDYCLLGTENSRAQGHTDSYTHRIPLDEIESPGVIAEEAVHEFEIELPPHEAPVSQTGVNYEVQWLLELRLHIPWAKDPVTQVPIQIV